jgi:hypothetical protein
VRADNLPQRTHSSVVHSVRSFAFAAKCFLLSACSSSTPAELSELVLRTEIPEIPEDFVVCVSVDERDATESLLSRLRSSTRVVVPASECEWVLDTTKGSFHRASGRKAMLVDVSANLHRDEVEYVGRHHGMWAVRLTLKVKVDNGSWRIVDTIKRSSA